MLAAWAVCVADGKDKPEQGTQAPVIGYDVELERIRLEIEERKFKLKEEKLAAERAEKVSVVNLAKRYGDAMKASVKTIGPEMLDVVLFFRYIESIFKRFDVPAKLQAALIQPYLNDKARSVVSRMDPSQCDDYKIVRDVTLKEHKLTPCAYLDLLNKLTLQLVKQQLCTVQS